MQFIAKARELSFEEDVGRRVADINVRMLRHHTDMAEKLNDIEVHFKERMEAFEKHGDEQFPTNKFIEFEAKQVGLEVDLPKINEKLLLTIAEWFQLWLYFVSDSIDKGTWGNIMFEVFVKF